MKTTSYGFLDRIVRTNVFQFGVYSYGRLERVVMAIYRFFAHEKGNRSYSPERVERSYKQLSELGEEFNTSSGVNGMLFSAKKVTEIIKKHGGTWKKITCDDRRTLMAIEEPETSTWNEWADQALIPLGWKREKVFIAGAEKNVIVTSTDADSIVEESACFLWSHPPAMTFAFGKQRIGFYLGMKQDFCAYDPRGWGKSKGSPTEASLYEDAESVFDFLTQMRGYPSANVWATGQCLGAAVSTYLKSQYPEINLIVEQSFLKLKNILDGVPAFLKWLAKDHLKAMQRGNNRSENLFDVSRRLKSQNMGSGKIIVAGAVGDPVVTEETVDRWVKKAGQISNSVTKVMFIATHQKDPHLECATHDQNLRYQYKQVIFAS